MADKKKKKTAKEKREGIGRAIMADIGDAVAWANEEIGPPFNYVNPLTVFEDSPEAQSVRQGLTLGWGDELAGAIGGEEAGDEARQAADEFREDRPGAAMAGEVAGSLALPGGFAGRGLGALMQTRRLAPAVGALEGAAYGAGTGEGARDRATQAAIGGAGGFAGGAIAQKALRPIEDFAYNQNIAKHLPEIRHPKERLYVGKAEGQYVFVDPQSIKGGKLYHTTPAKNAETILKEGLRRNRESTSSDRPFNFLSNESATPALRKTIQDDWGWPDVETIEIDAAKLQAPRLMLDVANVPDKGPILSGFQNTYLGAQNRGLANRLFQYADEIPPEAITRIVPSDEIATFAGPRFALNQRALENAKHQSRKLGTGKSQIKTLSPDEAARRLRELTRASAQPQ